MAPRKSKALPARAKAASSFGVHTPRVPVQRATRRLLLMRNVQAALAPSPTCLDGWREPSMMQLRHREAVVQFINEVCEDFGLMTQTAGLAVCYFDRYVSKSKLAKERVHLLAITCCLIASKFLEIKMPGLNDLCDVVGNKYTKANVKEAELETLSVLQWKLHNVTPHTALEQLAIIMDHTDAHFKPILEHAEFFIDMSYYLYKSLRFAPLTLAASALLCAWAHLGNVKAIELHLPQLSDVCGERKSELMRCKAILQDYFTKTFPKAAEEAEKYRAASSAGRESPDSVMTMAPGHCSDSPANEAIDAKAPDFCFSPLR